MRHGCLVFAVLALSGCAHQPDYYSTFISPTEGQPATRMASAEAVDCVVYFDLDSAQIKPNQDDTLDQCAKNLAASPVHVALAGHADERGPDRYNFDLGMRRSEAVERELVKRGVPADRISVTSYGEQASSVAAAGEAQWSQDRRVNVAPGDTQQDRDSR